MKKLKKLRCDGEDEMRNSLALQGATIVPGNLPLHGQKDSRIEHEPKIDGAVFSRGR